ncbi:Cof-type HAD-IIB family hydrolase [Pasteurella canis]|uniref:Cof-type HAD-IIB family hydrolase n=1 Tax=Pasteurella canis TaxID=753 RepID=UPI0006653F38|nr:Cof-type HAD-IIB family hydrolase [Pasteurella canis]MXN89424.1 Cof-type HAD-IIB family hydrolase [Pasteurella canis]UAX41791.1 Cof-type HAD-IIB family hydrolase [Pasteurella canis]UEA16433.1 Cof-type HAD-IIB family hydrolase [Pasteurella canis]SPY34281.1 putative bifunctional phosphatase/peptidyl-prolyl cis-trans isomerase [Pasteurella canis]GJJ79994.1 hydrolase [Pasteurella canis]
MTIPNYREQIKIVFFDIDETLLVKDKDYLPDATVSAIQKLKANGIIPAIATGRTPSNFPPKIKELIQQTQIDLFVTMNGQYVSYQGATLEKNPLSKQKIQQLVDFFTQHQIEYAQISPTDTCVSAVTDKVRSALDPLRGHYYENKDYFKQHDVFQILAFYEQQQDELVNSSGVLKGLQAVRWHEQSVDLFDEHISKATGIAAAIQHLGFSMQNVMAFGDGLNDIEMLTIAGVGVAMGNAHQDLKAIADHVTLHIEEDGIYSFLKKAKLID